jgi:hypothetical protein
MLDMAEGCGSQGKNRTPDLGVRDDLNAEDVCKSWSTVGTKRAKDEILAFLIEDKNPTEHDAGCNLSTPGT